MFTQKQQAQTNFKAQQECLGFDGMICDYHLNIPRPNLCPSHPSRTGAEPVKNKKMSGEKCKIILMTYFYSVPPELSVQDDNNRALGREKCRTGEEYAKKKKKNILEINGSWYFCCHHYLGFTFNIWREFACIQRERERERKKDSFVYYKDLVQRLVTDCMGFLLITILLHCDTCL